MSCICIVPLFNARSGRFYFVFSLLRQFFFLFVQQKYLDFYLFCHLANGYKTHTKEREKKRCERTYRTRTRTCYHTYMHIYIFERLCLAFVNLIVKVISNIILLLIFFSIQRRNEKFGPSNHLNQRFCCCCFFAASLSLFLLFWFTCSF